MRLSIAAINAGKTKAIIIVYHDINHLSGK
jgi:hypothetical protein